MTSLLFCGFIKAVAFCSPIESKWSVVLLGGQSLDVPGMFVLEMYEMDLVEKIADL